MEAGLICAGMKSAFIFCLSNFLVLVFINCARLSLLLDISAGAVQVGPPALLHQRSKRYLGSSLIVKDEKSCKWPPKDQQRAGIASPAPSHICSCSSMMIQTCPLALTSYSSIFPEGCLQLLSKYKTAFQFRFCPDANCHCQTSKTNNTEDKKTTTMSARYDTQPFVLFASTMLLNQKESAWLHPLMCACVAVRVRTCTRKKLIISVGAEQGEQIKALSRIRHPIQAYLNGAGESAASVITR